MKDYLICIDSDGCAIDSMEIKHRRCFGPCMIKVWHLENWQEEILNRWNEINLYSMTRGINRFLGLEKMLTEITESYTLVEGLEEYSSWCQTTDTFSNEAIEDMIRVQGHPIFEKVLKWSKNVNCNIREISPEIRPFDGVRESLEKMKPQADIVIVSSANPQAVKEEWTRFGFMELVDHVMAQDAGTKTECIRRLLEKGYEPDKVLVLGDAPGDERAATNNGVLFYPILAGYETESWKRLQTEGLDRLFSGTYDRVYEWEQRQRFRKNLRGE